MSNELATLQEKGLTAEEAEIVINWKARGKPGFARDRVDYMQSIYNLGYTCQDIVKILPNLELGAVLHARVLFEFDKRREDWMQQNQQNLLAHAMMTETDRVATESLLLRAANQKIRQELMEYLANPDKVDPPEYLPHNLKQYLDLATHFNETLTGGNKDKKDAAPVTQPAVFINAPNASVSTVDPKDVAKMMVDQMKAGKK